MEKELERTFQTYSSSIWQKTETQKIAGKGLYEVWFTMVHDPVKTRWLLDSVQFMDPQNAIKIIFSS